MTPLRWLPFRVVCLLGLDERALSTGAVDGDDLAVRAPRLGDRDPRADEVAHHLPWLWAQLDVIQPRLLVPLGNHALRRFAPDARIGEVHGRVLERDGRTLFPMYHPAAAMHNQRLLPTLVADARALREAL